MNFSDFIGNLKTHEIEMKVHKEREPLKKKSIELRTNSSIAEEDEFMDEGKEEEFVMLVRKVEKLFYKQGRMSNLLRSRWKGKEELGLCYHCKKSGHLIAERQCRLYDT